MKQFEPEQVTRDLVSYPGEIVIRGLQLLILPVVFCSLVSGMIPHFNYPKLKLTLAMCVVV